MIMRICRSNNINVLIAFINKSLLLGVILFWFVDTFLFAGWAEPVQIFGYVRTEIASPELDDMDPLYLYKLRLDFESSLSERLFLGGNINFLHYRGKNTGNFLNDIPESIAVQVPSNAVSFFDYTFDDEIVWDNLFIKYRFPEFDITLGKQQITFGSGYVWNPTDLFNIKSVIDPTGEKEGHKALRVDYPLGFQRGIMFIYDLEDPEEETGMLLQYKMNRGHFDYFFTLASTWRDFTDYSTLTSIRERSFMAGFDMVGEAFGIGLWFEGAYNWPETQKEFYEFVLGGDYTWPNGLYVLLEYFHSSRGCSGSGDCNISDWMGYFTGETKAISRDNLYIYSSFPVTDLLEVGISMATSISDGSSVLIPVMDYSLYEDIHLELYGGFNLGSHGTVYSKELGNGILGRLTWYF